MCMCVQKRLRCPKDELGFFLLTINHCFRHNCDAGVDKCTHGLHYSNQLMGHSPFDLSPGLSVIMGVVYEPHWSWHSCCSKHGSFTTTAGNKVWCQKSSSALKQHTIKCTLRWKCDLQVTEHNIGNEGGAFIPTSLSVSGPCLASCWFLGLAGSNCLKHSQRLSD